MLIVMIAAVCSFEAAKLEKVLADFWREVPDLKLREGQGERWENTLAVETAATSAP